MCCTYMMENNCIYCIKLCLLDTCTSSGSSSATGYTATASQCKSSIDDLGDPERAPHQWDCIAQMCVDTTDQPCLQPYICLNISRKLNVLMHLHVNAGQCWGTARVQRWQPQWRRLKIKDTRHLSSCLSQQLRTDHQQQAALQPYKIIHGGAG